jgi:hypothetical protein
LIIASICIKIYIPVIFHLARTTCGAEITHAAGAAKAGTQRRF